MKLNHDRNQANFIFFDIPETASDKLPLDVKSSGQELSSSRLLPHHKNNQLLPHL